MIRALPRIIPFAIFIAFIALAGVLDNVALALGMDPRWWYAVRVAIVAALLAWFWRQYGELHGIAGVGVTHWALAVATGAAIFVLWINLDVGPLTLGKAPGFDPRNDGVIDWGLALTRLAGATLVVPLMEELFWRSLVMRWVHRPAFLSVAPADVGWKALALSSVPFALEHHLWFAGLLAGVAYGWLYIRAGNLWVPVVAHTITNGLLGIWVLHMGRWEFW
jgi:CAAX prenyl protease-like protein